MKRRDAASGRGRRLIQVAAVAAGVLMLTAATSWAIGGGLLNPSFEQGSGSSLDNWKVATYDSPDPGNREIVYGPGADPVPCEAGDPYGICVVEEEDSFVVHDWNTDEDHEITVPVLDGEKMVRLGGPYLHSAIRQSLDSMTIEQTFTVDQADPVVPLSYNLFTWDEVDFDDLSLTVRVTSPGHQTVTERIEPGPGVGSEVLTNTGWQSTKLNLSGYEGDTVSLEVRLSGTEDRMFGTWAYIDAGTAKPPFPGNELSLKAPAQTPTGKPVTVRSYLDSGNGQTHFVIPVSQVTEFHDDCMPYEVSVPFDPQAGTVDDLWVKTSYGYEDASEGPNNLWTAEIECADVTDIGLAYTLVEDAGSRIRVSKVGSLTLIDPIGVVFDADLNEGWKALGRTDAQAKSASLLSGATVTLQRLTPNGAVDVKTGDWRIFPSVTPQVTTDDGAFQWYMFDGMYRVSVTHPDFQPATSAWVDSEDWITNLDVGLIPKQRGPRLAPIITGGLSTQIDSDEVFFPFQKDPAEIMPVTGFECSLDGAAFVGCQDHISYRNLKPGDHSFRVRAKNANGVGPIRTHEWKQNQLPLVPVLALLEVKPKKQAVKRGKKANFRVKFVNSGNTPARNVKVCVTGPKKLVKLPRCQKIASALNQKFVVRNFKVKVRKSAKKGKKIKLRIVVSANRVDPISTGAQIRVR